MGSRTYPISLVAERAVDDGNAFLLALHNNALELKDMRISSNLGRVYQAVPVVEPGAECLADERI